MVELCHQGNIDSKDTAGRADNTRLVRTSEIPRNHVHIPVRRVIFGAVGLRVMAVVQPDLCSTTLYFRAPPTSNAVVGLLFAILLHAV